jgi:hypothetical protein
MGEMKTQIPGGGEHRTWKHDALEIFLEYSRLDLTYK